MHRILITSLVSFGLFSLQAQPPTDASSTTPSLTQTTTDVLAFDWLKPGSIKSLLAALQYLSKTSKQNGIVGPQPEKALCALIDADNAKADLFQADMGLPGFDCKGPATDITPVSSPVDILKILATANTNLYANTIIEQDQLFKDADKLLGDIFKKNKSLLVAVNTAFQPKDKPNYVALSQLLNAYPADSPDKATYRNSLEILRTAFAADQDRLAKLVAARVQ